MGLLSKLHLSSKHKSTKERDADGKKVKVRDAQGLRRVHWIGPDLPAEVIE